MIKPADRSKTAFFQDKIDNLNKPKGSLGRLESLALQMCLIQDTDTPSLHHPCHILFGGDHGIEREGVSFSPREVTWQQMINYTRGGGGVNMFCRQHGFELKIVDVGVDHDFDHTEYPQIIDRKIAYGTNDFLHGPAMDEAEWERALSAGAEQVDACFSEGCNIVSFGEMGIGNTTTSSAVAAVLLGQPIETMTGRGAGLSDEGLACKMDAIRRGIAVNTPDAADPLDVLAKLGGFDLAGLCGVFLGGALEGIPVLMDGFISGVAALCAVRLCPAAAKAVFASHCSSEPAARLVLEALGKAPLLTAGLHLGEGTGAVASIPLWDMALAVYDHCYSFAEGGITPYTPQC